MTARKTVPKGRRREAQKMETYALILDSARLLFGTEGFEKTTMRAVAQEAQIALGTIYKHFKNKTSLLAAAFYDDLVRLFHEARGTLPREGDLKARFLHLVKFNLYFYTERPNLSREYLRHILFADEEWLGKIEAFEQAYLKQVREWVDSSRQQGEIRPEKESHFMAVSLMADYFFVLSDLFLRQKINDPEELLSFLGKMLDQLLE